jgi:ABC-type phosphate/phosphonate transport system ATPase subunit
MINLTVHDQDRRAVHALDRVPISDAARCKLAWLAEGEQNRGDNGTVIARIGPV